MKSRWLAVGVAVFAVDMFGCGSTSGLRGHASAEARVFFQTPRFPEQVQGTGFSLVAEPEVFLQSGSEEHLLSARPFLRLDQFDDRRTHWDIRRADYVFTKEAFELGAGVGLFTWRVLEGHGIVDVVNQKDLVETLDGTSKLGQPYVELAWLPGNWSLRFLALPWFRGATFPGETGRNRFALVVDTDNPEIESSLGQWHPSFALRLAGSVGDVDLGVSLFSGISREPRFIAQLTSPTLVPAYDLAHQTSIDLQWTLDAWTFKLEALARLWSEDLSFLAAVGGGLDYTFFDMGGSGADLSFALEYHFDSRPNEAAVTFFQNDVFGGLRLAFNDTGSTRIVVGSVVDVGDLRTYLRAEIERRFFEQLRVAVKYQGYFGPEGELESGLLVDDHLWLGLAYFF